MEEQDYIFWEYHHISCEENTRWGIARTPSDWTEDDLEDAIMSESRCGDDPAEFSYAVMTLEPEDGHYIDFC